MLIRKAEARKRARGAAVIALALGGLTASFTAGCAPQIDRRGYVADETQPQDVQSGVDTKSTVLTRLGSPSTIAAFDPNAWYYISDVKERRTYHLAKTVSRSVIAVKFGENDVVSDVKTYTLADGRVFNYSDRKTPTRGRELSLIEQIFGNIGRTTTMPEDDELGNRRR
jgi:outer membrane protein assembly factor BamE (lipoprotein component of BamABCDE complex)